MKVLGQSQLQPQSAAGGVLLRHLPHCARSLARLPCAAQGGHQEGPRVPRAVPHHVRQHWRRPAGLQQGASTAPGPALGRTRSADLLPAADAAPIAHRPRRACGPRRWALATFTTSWACRCAAPEVHRARHAEQRPHSSDPACTPLAAQVVEACWATRSSNGGLFELSQLTRAVNRRRGSRADPVTADDLVRRDGTEAARPEQCAEWLRQGGAEVMQPGAAPCMRACSQVRAIKKLRVLGGGFDVVTIGSLQVRLFPARCSAHEAACWQRRRRRCKRSRHRLVWWATRATGGAAQYVRSVPGELNLDKNHVLEAAQVRAHLVHLVEGRRWEDVWGRGLWESAG